MTRRMLVAGTVAFTCGVAASLFACGSHSVAEGVQAGTVAVTTLPGQQCTPATRERFCTFKFDDGVRCMSIRSEDEDTGLSVSLSCVAASSRPIAPASVTVGGIAH